MNDCFKEVSVEDLSPIVSTVGAFPSDFCDFTPFVIWAWQRFYKTEYAIMDGALILKHKIDNEDCYALLSKDAVKATEALLKELSYSTLTLSLVSFDQLQKLKEAFDVTQEEASEDWADYIYLHSDLAEFSGKRFAGQRNHINKFLSAVTSWSYEEITRDNVKEVASFYKELSFNTSNYNETALYEHDMLTQYLAEGYNDFSMMGGFIRADGKIVSFALGETVGDTLFVHVEKARRDVPGAYQMIVREFARHNPAIFVNREEDMGIEGLRTSKKSYHPLRLAMKYKVKISKK
ncbi:MAG: DUF2156 domain-containing protein [Clostridia bacterium]|nr:DUF2156 domain-containing protein [Clostridia bacterium]